MPKIDFHIGVWGIVDANSPEEKQFTTYLHYWEAVAEIIRLEYAGTAAKGIRLALTDGDPKRAKKFRALSSKQFKGDELTLSSLLLNAWNSELGLYLVDEDDPRVMPQNQWNNVFSYYASGRVALAWLMVRDQAVPNQHRALLDALANQCGERVSLFPEPWCFRCTSHKPLEHGGFRTPPRAVSNLSAGADPYDVVAKMLKTTRGKRLTKQMADTYPNCRTPNGARARCDSTHQPTTVFDFLWRSRTRANYGDPSMFYVGTLGHDRAARYLRAVRTVNNATMSLFEILIAERARSVLLDTADHFISRDRTGITANVLVKRLECGGILRTP